MKKAKIITIILLIVVNVWMRFYAPIFNVALILKHVSLFILIGIIAYIVLTYLLKKIVGKYKPTGNLETTVYVGRVLIFGCIILLVGALQIDYVQYSETPYIEHCRYYDNYNHLVYETMIYESCPELEIIESNGNELEFNVSEVTNVRQVASIAPEQKDLGPKDQYSASMYTSIRIEYDYKHRIVSVDQQMTMISETIDRDGEIDTYYYSYHKKVINDYSMNYDATYSEAEVLNHYDGIIDIYTGHHNFVDDDYNTTRYYADNYILDDTSSEGIGWVVSWEYDLVKEYTEETELIKEKLAHVKVEHENNVFHTTILRENRNSDGDSNIVTIRLEEGTVVESVQGTRGNSIDFHWQHSYNEEEPYILELTQHFDEEGYPSYVNEYNNYQIRNTNYLYIGNNGLNISDDSPFIYGITETEFGFQASYERYRQNYYTGAYIKNVKSDVVYFEDGRYSYGLRYQILFDVEYSLDWLVNSRDVMFTHPSYVAYTAYPIN